MEKGFIYRPPQEDQEYLEDTIRATVLSISSKNAEKLDISVGDEVLAQGHHLVVLDEDNQIYLAREVDILAQYE